MYIPSGITSNPEMVYNIWEDVQRFYTNTIPFYIEDLQSKGSPGLRFVKIGLHEISHVYLLYMLWFIRFI